MTRLVKAFVFTFAAVILLFLTFSAYFLLTMGFIWLGVPYQLSTIASSGSLFIVLMFCLAYNAS